MAQIIQIKRTAVPVGEVNVNKPTALLKDDAGNNATLEEGELLWATATVDTVGSGVLYVGNGTESGTGADMIGGTAFTSMLNPDDTDTAKTVLSQATTAAAGSLALADIGATNTVTLEAPNNVTSDSVIKLPTAAGVVEASALLSANADGKVAANLISTAKVTGETGLDANNSGITNTGTIANVTAIDKVADTTTPIPSGSVLIDTSGVDAGGNSPPHEDGLWNEGDDYVNAGDSPGVDVDLGYTGQLDVGGISLNAAQGKIQGSTLDAGAIVASESITTNEFTAASGAYIIDVSGNVNTTAEIRSTRTDGDTPMIIDDGSITNALNVQADGTVTADKFTDGVASLEDGQLTGSAGVTVTAGGNVTSPVLQTTGGAAKLDGDAVSGATLALSGNAAIKGTLEVSSGIVQTSTSDVTIADSMVQVAADGFGQNVTNDLGWFGNTSRELVAGDTGIIGQPRTIRVILATDATTYGFVHGDGAGTGVLTKNHVDGAGNAAPAGGWAAGDAFVVGPVNYPTTDNSGNWALGNKYLTYAGMAYDTFSGDFKLLQNDTKPGTNWDTGTSTKATLVADLTGDVTGDLTGNADTVTTNANLTGGVTSVGNAATVVTNANLTGDVTSVGNATVIAPDAVHATMINEDVAGTNLLVDQSTGALNVDLTATTAGSINAQISTKITNEATSTISGATDTTISGALAEKDVFSYDDTNDVWVNRTLSAAGIQPTTGNANGSTAGLMSSAHYTKVEGVATNATNTAAPEYPAGSPIPVANTDANNLNDGLMSEAMATKLAGIAEGATAGATGSKLEDLSDVPTPVVGDNGFKLQAIHDGTNISYDWTTDDDTNRIEDADNTVLNSHVNWGTGSADQIDTDDIPEGTKKFYATSLFNTDLGTKTTNDLAEGAGGSPNLYYTDERVDDRVGHQTNGLIKKSADNALTWVYADNGAGAGTLTPTVSLAGFSTSDLSQGTNEYYTSTKADARANAMIAAADTGDLSEGTNKYYTNERVDDRVANQTNGLIQKSANDSLTWVYTDSDENTAGTLVPTVSLTPFDTDALSEGTTGTSNLYYTNDRVTTQVGTLSSSTATADTIVKWDGSKNINSDGLTIGATGIAGVASQDIKVTTNASSDSVVVTFGSGGSAKTITLGNSGITAVGDSMSLSGFTADGGTLVSQ